MSCAVREISGDCVHRGFFAQPSEPLLVHVYGGNGIARRKV
jgi:hypothetical protein